MSKLLAIVASLKAILIAVSFAFARGDMLSVILISLLFNLAELGPKPVGSDGIARQHGGLATRRSRLLISNSRRPRGRLGDGSTHSTERSGPFSFLSSPNTKERQ
jgi:hypothetical protein